MTKSNIYLRILGPHGFRKVTTVHFHIYEPRNVLDPVFGKKNSQFYSVQFGFLRYRFFPPHLFASKAGAQPLLMGGAGGGTSGPRACALGLPAAFLGPSGIIEMSNAGVEQPMTRRQTLAVGK